MRFWVLPVSVVVGALGLLTGLWVALGAQQTSPGRPPAPVIYFGTVTVDGRSARTGSRVNAYVGGAWCSSAVTEGNAYSMSVPSVGVAPERQECLTQNAILAFRVNGVPASPIAPVDLEAGLIGLNLQAAAPCANLTPAWNNIAYLGPDRPVEEAIAPILGALDSVFRYSNASKEWQWFLAGVAGEVNTLKELKENDALWVRVKAPAQWCW